MTRIKRIGADLKTNCKKIRTDPSNPRHPRAISPNKKSPANRQDSFRKLI